MIKRISPSSEFIGSFIAASPFLFDPEFCKSVILITHWDGKGYSGFKINHVLSPKAQNTTGALQAYNGGPIAKRTANILHSPDIKWDKTRQINENICLTNIDKNMIDLAKDTLPAKYFIVFGCTSWNKGQLEEEIINGFWMPVNADHDLLFNVPLVNRWYSAYQTTMITPDCVSMDSCKC